VAWSGKHGATSPRVAGRQKTRNFWCTLKLFKLIRHLYSTNPLNVAETLLDIAMMHSDSLIARAREGDKTAQSKLVQLWYKRIYNFGYKFFYDHDLAMEVAQKTFISMHKNIAGLQEVTRFKSWLYTIAVNYCREEARKRKTNRALSLNDLKPGEGEESYRWEESHQRRENPERQLRQSELSDLLQSCLMELSAEQREVVIMKEYEGLKFREIAETLGISENTVKSRMYYGLEGLKKILEQKKITKETIGYEL
jgi:RNA polymerase sigma factor (sigma-70 family)